jgi:hypothetical protein
MIFTLDDIDAGSLVLKNKVLGHAFQKFVNYRIQLPLYDMGDDAFDRMIATNIKVCFNVLREASRRTRDGGSIISLSSSIIQTKPADAGAYPLPKLCRNVRHSFSKINNRQRYLRDRSYQKNRHSVHNSLNIAPLEKL